MSVTPPTDPETQALCVAAQQAAFIVANTDLAGTIGISYVGVAISSMVYGVTCIQTFHYFRSTNSKDDPTLFRSIVLLLLLLDTAHQAIIIRTLYHYVITNYANPFALLNLTWSIPTEIIINAIIAAIVEAFFVMRIWKLSRNIFVTGACGVFTIAHLTMNLVFPIRAFFNTALPEGELKLKNTGSAGLVIAVVADTAISAAMVWYLQKGKSGIRRSDDMIGRIIALTVTTGSLTTLFVILDLITYQIWPTLLYNLAINFLLGKLYINAFLTSLNSRTFVREGGKGQRGVGSITLSTFQADSTHIRTSDFTSGHETTLADVSYAKNVSVV